MPEIFSGIFYVYRVSGKALFSEIIAFPENKEKECYPAGKKPMLIFLFIVCKQLAFSEKILLLKVK